MFHDIRLLKLINNLREHCSAVTMPTNPNASEKNAVPVESHQDAALLRLSQVEGGSIRRMQTVSAAHSNCVSTCYAARIWSKCTAQRLHLISPKHCTVCFLIHYSLSSADCILAYTMYLCGFFSFEASQNLILLSGHI